MANSPSRPLAGLRILVVEDNYMVAQLLSDMLEDLGCVVIGPFGNARSGAKAVEINILDGAVLDVNLGGGLTSASVAVALQVASIPFVVATGYGELPLTDEVLHRAPRITKPINEAELEAITKATFIRRRLVSPPPPRD